MSQWSHLHKHQVNYDRELVIDFLHNPEALLGISKEVTSVKQVPLDDETDGDAEECWLGEFQFPSCRDGISLTTALPFL